MGGFQVEDEEDEAWEDMVVVGIDLAAAQDPVLAKSPPPAR